MKILIVEEKHGLLESLSNNLWRQGYWIKSARDLAGTLELAHDFRPEFIIVDIKLPGLDGPDFFRRIRRELSGVPIFFWSHQDQESDEDARLEPDGNRWFSRLFSTRELHTQLQAHFRSQQILKMLQGEAVFS